MVRGYDGPDEISTAAPTRVWVTGNAVTPTTINAAEFGLPRSVLGDLWGGDAPTTPPSPAGSLKATLVRVGMPY